MVQLDAHSTCGADSLPRTDHPRKQQCISSDLVLPHASQPSLSVCQRFALRPSASVCEDSLPSGSSHPNTGQVGGSLKWCGGLCAFFSRCFLRETPGACSRRRRAPARGARVQKLVITIELQLLANNRGTTGAHLSLLSAEQKRRLHSLFFPNGAGSTFADPHDAQYGDSKRNSSAPSACRTRTQRPWR